MFTTVINYAGDTLRSILYLHILKRTSIKHSKHKTFGNHSKHYGDAFYKQVESSQTAKVKEVLQTVCFVTV